MIPISTHTHRPPKILFTRTIISFLIKSLRRKRQLRRGQDLLSSNLRSGLSLLSWPRTLRITPTLPRARRPTFRHHRHALNEYRQQIGMDHRLTTHNRINRPPHDNVNVLFVTQPPFTQVTITGSQQVRLNSRHLTPHQRPTVRQPRIRHVTRLITRPLRPQSTNINKLTSNPLPVRPGRTFNQENPTLNRSMLIKTTYTPPKQQHHTIPIRTTITRRISMRVILIHKPIHNRILRRLQPTIRPMPTRMQSQR